MKAYSDATKLAIDEIKIQTKNLAIEYKLEIPYNEYNTIRHYCSSKKFIITENSFSDVVVLQIIINANDEAKFTEEIKEKLEGRCELIKVRDNFYI